MGQNQSCCSNRFKPEEPIAEFKMSEELKAHLKKTG